MEEIIAHYGIKGMKWGVRRYQNKDGSLTPAGKERYSDDDEKRESDSLGKIFDQNIKIGKDKSPISAAEKISKETEKVIENSTKLSNAISNIRRKKRDTNTVSSLTDDELKTAIERMRLEDTFSELSQKRIDKGKSSVENVLAIAGSVVGIVSSIAGIASTVRSFTKK